MKKVRVGFIGVGGIASTHLENMRRNAKAEIIAVCDVNGSRAELAGQEFSAAAYTEYGEMLEKETLDAIFLSIPPFAHGDIEEMAAQKGLHMMVEKPVGLDMPEALRKQSIIEKSGVICATGYCLRYLDSVEKAKSFLEGKEIAMVRGKYLTKFVETPWYREMKKSGGQLVEQATHIVDLIRYLAGDMDEVQAHMKTLVSGDIASLDIPDVTSVNFTLKSGALGHLDCSFIQPDHRMGLEILGKGFRVEINGTDVVLIEGNNREEYKATVDFYERQDNAFIDAILTNDRSLILSDYENGLSTLAATLAANDSAAGGKSMKIEELYKSVPS